MIDAAIALAIAAFGFFAIARLLPGFEIRGGYGSAVIVALVYGLLKAVLQTLLIVVTLPMVIISLGLFILVINAFILWLTDKLLTRFEIKSLGALVAGTLLLGLFDLVTRGIITHGSFL